MLCHCSGVIAEIEGRHDIQAAPGRAKPLRKFVSLGALLQYLSGEDQRQRAQILDLDGLLFRQWTVPAHDNPPGVLGGDGEIIVFCNVCRLDQDSKVQKSFVQTLRYILCVAAVQVIMDSRMCLLEFTADGREEPIVDQTEDEIAGYADFRQSLGRLTVDAGVRIDHHTRTGTEWVPQAGISLRAARDGALKAMVSKGFRNPVLRELYMFGVKNPDLKPERLWNYELSWTQRLAGGSVSYGVNLFYIKGEDIIRRGRADGRNILLNQARIENWGAEADAAWRIGGGWSVNANYSWLRMEYPVPASPEHKLYAGGDFGKGRWSVSTGVQYIAGLYTAAAPDPEVREAGFVLWNLRASLRVNRLLTIFVRGENLLAERYEINAGYPMPRATVFGGLKLNL